MNYRNDDAETRPSIVGLHYRVGKKIGEGSFGIICEGINVLDNKPVAIKFESKKSDAPQLREEYKNYKSLSGCHGIPLVYYYGQEGLCNCLVMDLLGPSLEDLFDLCGRRLSIQTVALLAIQMITRVQTIHEKNFIYRDIKPDNFLIGRKKESVTIYAVDFGMAKIYRDPKSKQHIPYKERKSLSGTARYMSINTHLGREQSRRDDLEALGNVFLYFLRGSLPWQGLKAANNKQKYEKIGEKKQQVSVRELCEGFPDEFAAYMNYVRKLGFEDTPDYEFLKNLFTNMLTKMNVKENVFDWMLLPRKREDDKLSSRSVSTPNPNESLMLLRSRDGVTRSQVLSSSANPMGPVRAELTDEQINYLVMMKQHPAILPNQHPSVQYPNLNSSPYVHRHQTSSNQAMYDICPPGSRADLSIPGQSDQQNNIHANNGALISSSQLAGKPLYAKDYGKAMAPNEPSSPKKRGWFKRCFCCCFKSQAYD